MENSFKTVAEKTKSVLVLLPTRPYFDQVAAGLALFLALREDRQAQVACPTPITVEFNRLIGVNKISQDLGNKNLIIRFTDYKAADIERVSYDIENGQFRLTVIPKQSINPPTKGQVELSYSGVSADTVIIIGGASESHFPAITSKELVGADLVHVGTRDITLSSNKSYVSFSRPASSVSEVVYGLIKESGLKMDEDVATNLLMGIEEGSSKFTEGGVTAETFAIFADLMKLGGKRISAQQPAMRRDFPAGAIPGAPTVTAPHVTQPSPVQQTAVPRPQVTPQVTQPQVTPQVTQPQMAPQITQPQVAPQAAQPPAQAAKPAQTQKSNDDKKEEQDAPKDWLEPKIYKGTSIS